MAAGKRVLALLLAAAILCSAMSRELKADEGVPHMCSGLKTLSKHLQLCLWSISRHETWLLL